MSELQLKKRPKKKETDQRLRSAQTNLQKMLETIAPYSNRPVEEDEPPIRWVGKDQENESLVQSDT
jgi:hypothetical protein